jgi:hypothetical protein
LARPDVPVFPPEAEDHLDLQRPPFQGVADSHRGAESWLDVGHDAVHLACFDMADEIPEGRQGRLDYLVGAAERLADRGPRLVDAVPGRLDPALAACQGRPASADLVGRWAQPLEVGAPCIPDEARSAA